MEAKIEYCSAYLLKLAREDEMAYDELLTGLCHHIAASECSPLVRISILVTSCSRSFWMRWRSP